MMAEYAKEVVLLRKRFKATPTEGLEAKRVKFQELADCLTTHYPDKKYSPKSVSTAIKLAFPESYSRRVGKSKLSYYFGIEESSDPTPVTPQPSASGQQQMAMDSEEQLRMTNRQLTERIKELECRIHQLEQAQSEFSPDNLLVELDALTQRNVAAYHGPDTVEHLERFSMDTITADFVQHAPHLYQLLCKLGQGRCQSDTQKSTQAIMCLCALMKGRSKMVLGMQLLITFMLIARATSRQAITVLNSAGVCVSYVSAWQHLRQLAIGAQYLEVVRSGHWIWIYDNMNLHQGVRHEREDKHSKMLNITSRLAVRIRHFPDWEFDWADTRPQMNRDLLTISDFLSSEVDAAELKKRAVNYIMNFLVQEFPALSDLKKFLPGKPEKVVAKSEVVPMEVLFKDEKYIAETIDILSQLIEDARLSEQAQVVVGDQLTCKNIRGCKLWRQSELRVNDRLTWACEVPGDFHFLWECLRVVFKIFWGNPGQHGSLCNLREIIHRNRVTKDVKVFNVGDEFLLHVFKAHLTAAIMEELNIDTQATTIDHPQSLQWIKDKAELIVSQVLMPSTSTDPVYRMHRSLLHLSFLYVDLREAIRYECGEHIVRHWKWWLPRFIATGCSNYATEAVHLITNLRANFPKHISYIATHNRTVNMQGKDGKAKPLDQLIEHYNLVFKQTLRAAGGNLTDTHVKDVSMSALFLLDAAKKTDQAFGIAPQTTSHTVRDADSDIQKMRKHIIEHGVTHSIDDREVPTFIDPTDEGLKKMCNMKWLKETMAKSHVESDDVHEQGDTEDINIDYEIYNNI